MQLFRQINKWVSDHKILSGFAGVLLLAAISIFFSKKENTNQSGNINFGNDAEINNSNVSGRDIYVRESNLNKESLNSDSIKQDKNQVPEKEMVKDLVPEKKINRENIRQDSIKNLGSKNYISHSYIAGRDIHINKKDQGELIETLKFRAENINRNLKRYYYYVEVAEFLDQFNTLHKKHINALRSNDFLLAHEILSSIHMLSFSLDAKEEKAQQINLYGDLRHQYLTNLDKEDLLGGIISLYFQKQIEPYDSTLYAGNIVYYNKLSNGWPGYPFINDSIIAFYDKNFLSN
jgi:hypothetical protein